MSHMTVLGFDYGKARIGVALGRGRASTKVQILNPYPHLEATAMRLLSLDFDGVLHPQDAELPEERRFCWLAVLESLLVDHPDGALADLR